MLIDLDTFVKFADALSRLSGPTLLALFIVLLYRGTLVWEGHCRELIGGLKEQLVETKADAREWKELALRGTQLAEKNADLALKVSGESPR